MAKLADLDIDAMMAAEGLEVPKSEDIDAMMAAEGFTAEQSNTPGFLQPHPIPGIPGMGGEEIAPAVTTATPGILYPRPEAPQEESRIFPTASQFQGDGIGAKAARVALGVGDLFGAPMRAVAEGLTDQKMSDPDAYALKPLVEKFHSLGGEGQPDTRPTDRPMFGNKVSFQDMARHLDSRSFSGAGDAWAEVLGRILSDPMAWLAPMQKLLGLAPNAVSAAGKAAGVVNKGAGRLSEEMSGVSEGALRKVGTAAGRARLESMAGKEGEIGGELLNKIDNADDYMPEKQIVDEGLKRLPPQSVQPAIDAMEKVRAETIREGGRVAPHARSAHGFIQGYIDYLRGGELPPDLAQAAQEAGRAAKGARAEALAAEEIAAKDAKAAAQATRAQASSQTKATKAAAKAGTIKRSFIAAADKAEKNVTRYGRERNAIGQEAEIALEDAQGAAAKAKQAAIDARAKVAVGEITEAEAVQLESAADRAAHYAIVSEVASRIQKGENFRDLVAELSARGMSKDDLRNIVRAAKDRVESLPKLPAQEMSAPGIRAVRQDLDVPIDFASEGGDIKKAALLAGRGTIKKQLIAAADASGDPGYAEAMRTWSDKLDKLDRIKDLIGKNGITRQKRVEQFIKKLFGKNNKYKTRLMEDLDGIFGSSLTADAKDAQMASQLGEQGKAGWLPRQATGRSMLGAATGVGAAIASGHPWAIAATPFFASPKIASRITLPALTKLEDGLKAAGVALTPKAGKLIAAMKKPITNAQRARLATLLASEMESQLQGGIVPFRKVVEAEDAKRYSRK